MFHWLRRRRLSDGGKRRLLIALARAEESLIETHVRNALDVVGAIGEEIPLDRALEIYIDAIEPGEPRASIIARRVLARLESAESLDARARGGRRRRVLEE